MTNTKVKTRRTIIPKGYRTDGYNKWAIDVLKGCTKRKEELIAADLGLLPRDKLRN